MALYPLKYQWMGMTVGVEPVPGSSRHIGIGRRPGHPRYPLDKLGDASDADAMQAKLDAWARRHGLRPINMPKADARQLALGI